MDTAFLSATKLPVAEVSGSCFCCNFNGFSQAIRQLLEADVILAEPVGSCADLSATLIHPLKQYLNREIRVAPLSVLADPLRLESILNGENAGLHPDAAYIYRKQLEESDCIVLNKSDLLEAAALSRLTQQIKEAYPTSNLFIISAKEGSGIEAWLDFVLNVTEAGTHLLQLDYDTYARGEAVLGWLNGTVQLTGSPTNWEHFVRSFMEALNMSFKQNGLAIGHVKVLAETDFGRACSHSTGLRTTLTHNMTANSPTATLTINARVETTPETLDQFVRQALETTNTNGLSMDVQTWKTLIPGRPKPTHRFEQRVV